jgi:peptidoglycan/LPS O-acetylase OafA/YrhL
MATERTPAPPVPRAPPPALTTPDASVPGPGRHFAALDGLRGLAVLFVLIFHIFQVEAEPASGLPRLAYKATRIGQTGVDLFFVLSGFLITGILHDTKGTGRYFRNFYGRRTVRIFPLYYGALIVATIVLPILLGHRVTDANPLALWTYTANIPGTFGLEPQTFGHFWTLAVEEQFYLIWPAVVFAFARPSMMKVCVACIISAVFIRIGLLSMGLSANFFTFGRIDSLALGGLLALAARGPVGMTGWRPRATLVVIGMAILIAPFYVMKTGSHEAWLQVIKYSLLAVFYGAVLVLAVTTPASTPLGRFFHQPLLRFFGKYSYGIYVFHPFLIYAFALAKETDTTGALDTTTAEAIRVLSIVVLSVVSAWLSWHLFEKRFLNLKRYFEYAPPTAKVGDESPPGRPATARGLAIEG